MMFGLSLTGVNIIYRRPSAPVRYVTTQETVFKNSPVPGGLQIAEIVRRQFNL